MITLRSIARGIDAWSCGSVARMRSTVWMMLAPGSRQMMSRTDGLPFAMPKVRMSSTESCTVATSESRTGAPFR